MSTIRLAYVIPNGGTFEINVVDGELRLQGPSYTTLLTQQDITAITSLWNTALIMRKLTVVAPAPKLTEAELKIALQPEPEPGTPEYEDMMRARQESNAAIDDGRMPF